MVSDELLRRIQQAQVEAGEQAVVDDLQRKGLMLPKMGIVIDLDHLKRLMAEFCSETAGGSGPMDMQRRMHLSTFLAWVRKRQETTNVSPR